MKSCHRSESCRSGAHVVRGCLRRWRRAFFSAMVCSVCLVAAQGAETPINVFAGRKAVVLRDVQNAAEGETLTFRIAKEHLRA